MLLNSAKRNQFYKTLFKLKSKLYHVIYDMQYKIDNLNNLHGNAALSMINIQNKLTKRYLIK